MATAPSMPALQSVCPIYLCVEQLWRGLSEGIVKERFLCLRTILHANQYCAFSTQTTRTCRIRRQTSSFHSKLVLVRCSVQRNPGSCHILTRTEFVGVFIQKSLEPVAASAAGAELLGLLGVDGNPDDPFAESDLTALANLAPNDTTTVPIANDSTAPALVR